MPRPPHLQIATPGGVSVRVRPGGNDDFWAYYENGNWEPDTAAVFRRFLDAGHSYIDIGAWIGPALLLGCQPAGCAFGIEPDPLAYDELLANIESNRPLTDNVTLFNVCIAPVSGKVSFGSQGSGGDSMSSLLFAGGKTSWTVDGVSFQEWIAASGITDCNFAKIDIDGAGYSLLPTMPLT
jgi:FkbM family methyltransferase